MRPRARLVDGQTHSAKKRNLLREPTPGFLRYTLKVEYELREYLAVVLLPLSYDLQVLSRHGMITRLSNLRLSISRS